MAEVIIINASYRQGGVSDQITDVLKQTLIDKKANPLVIKLRDKDIRYCSNCRSCTQENTKEPGVCVIKDDMSSIIKELEKAQAYIFIVPTNMGSATALFKTFQERLIVYGYYPWGAPAPKYKKGKLTKEALCFSSCAAPSLIGKLFFYTAKQLKMSAKILGAKVLQTTFIGTSCRTKAYRLSKREIRSIQKSITRLSL
jgi:multimeric flavodoxin WrbA